MCPPKKTSRTSHIQINDTALIDWFKKNHKNIDFIAFKPHYDTYARGKQLFLDIGFLNEDKPLYKQKDKLLKLWKNLLGNAIVYLKSKDEREKYHDDEDYGVDRLYEFFETFCDFEGLLYGAKEYYRDHVSHMFRVFLLGEYLIRTKLKFKNIVVGDDELPKDKKITPNEKEAMWCIISLTHDLGYALETIPKINKKAREMLEQFGNINVQELSYTFPRQSLYDFITRFISSDLQKTNDNEFITRNRPKYFLKFSGALERNLHGIVSCIVVMRNLVYFLESDFTLDSHKPLKADDAKHFLIRCNILRSIASHDCDDIYYLTIPQFPFLLTIFDEMQEWERPRLSDLFIKTPDSNLIIKKFDKANVDYEIEIRYTESLTPDERKTLKANIKTYFKEKCKKIRRILRSAVGGELRKLTLTFEVTDKIGSSVKRYKIIHKKPDDVKTFIDNSKCTWQDIITE